jgi:hypothetical protein
VEVNRGDEVSESAEPAGGILDPLNLGVGPAEPDSVSPDNGHNRSICSWNKAQPAKDSRIEGASSTRVAALAIPSEQPLLIIPTLERPSHDSENPGGLGVEPPVKPLKCRNTR